jgi:N-acetylmuramoyl-L-alanine amidase
MALLSKLKKEYNIPTQNIIGHSDIAPSRKNDPSALFPWNTLAENGFGLWKDDILQTALSILILNRRYALSDMTLKIFPLPSKHLNYTLSKKEVDSVLNQNTINTIYSIYKKTVNQYYKILLKTVVC